MFARRWLPASVPRAARPSVIPCHIARKEELQKLVDQTTAQWGGIDIMVSNAAVNPYLGPAGGRVGRGV